MTLCTLPTYVVPTYLRSTYLPSTYRSVQGKACFMTLCTLYLPTYLRRVQNHHAVNSLYSNLNSIQEGRKWALNYFTGLIGLYAFHKLKLSST